MDLRVTELSVSVMPEAAYSAISAPAGDRLYAVVPERERFPLLLAVGYEYVPRTGESGEDVIKTGAYVSPDLGDTWIPIQVGEGNWTVNDVAYGDGVFMAATGELHRSYDCLSWEMTYTSALGLLGANGEGFNYGRDIVQFCNGEFYAVAISGQGTSQKPLTYRTRRGDQFQRQTTFIGTSGNFRTVHGMAFDRLSGHYLACDDSCQAMYAVDQVSSMHSQAWTSRRPSWASQYDYWRLAPAEDGIIVLAVKEQEHEDGDDYWYTYPAVAYKTTDGGNTWTEIWSHEDMGESVVDSDFFAYGYSPDSKFKYRYYAVISGYVWFSTDCQNWIKTALPRCSGGWSFAKQCDGGPVAAWCSYYDDAHDACEQTLAVGDLSSFETKRIDNGRRFNIGNAVCVGFSPPGARREDYLKMRPDFSNVVGQQAITDLFMPSGQWIDLTKEDVFMQSISEDGFVAPDAGWLFVHVSNLVRGGYLGMIVQQDGMHVSMGRDACQQGTATTGFMRMIPV